MSDDDIDDQDSPRQAKRDAPPPPDERDAIIERLERTVADERQNSAKLRNTVEDLRFKTDILEKSYAKQLADARLRSAAAEQQFADQQARLIALETSREETVRRLSETRAELERVTAERDLLSKQVDGLPTDAIAQDNAGSQAPEGTINELITNLRFTRERQPAPDSHLHQRVRDEQESPSEDMLAPELVFPKKGDRDDES
jgi:septal ring factor EnvC (AmiA/AmiB activator)